MMESNLTRMILHTLNSIEACEAVKHHGSAYSTVGEPDIYGCIEGRAFLIEVKVPGKKPTKIQNARMRKWKKAGARVGIATTVEEALAVIHGNPN